MKIKVTIEFENKIFEAEHAIDKGFAKAQIKELRKIVKNESDAADDIIGDLVIDWSDSLTDAIWNVGM